MKFVLVLYVCSILSQSCDNGRIPSLEFQSHKECSLMGYKLAYMSVFEMEDRKVNIEKIAVKFECRQINVFEDLIVPKKKPKVGA
jgi:hypothetical protein|tara:strand:- start:699 stop:953 length:255 start_codon:yes stop_codon:yes gene_type:complete